MVRTSEGADALASLLTSPLDGSLFADGLPESPTVGVGVTEDTQTAAGSDASLPGYIGSSSTLGATMTPGGGGQQSIVSHTTGTSSITIQTPVVTSDQAVTLSKIGLYGEDEPSQNVEPSAALWYEGLLNRSLALNSGDKTQVAFVIVF